MDWNDPEAKAKLKPAETLVRGDEWPIFIYQGYKYNPDDPWSGTFRSFILVNVFKHIFTSPSSVEKENKAARSGNTCIHGMMTVTHASIAYVTTQVRFMLSFSSTFSRTDSVTDSDRFYNTILRMFHDPNEVEEVNPLLHWWNWFFQVTKSKHTVPQT
ncbi:hypothetical protein DXG01_003234 [Tephrocybe rancida]|nr:hypothetical protein DXG01_003234 [Tephrocybe rancida]